MSDSFFREPRSPDHAQDRRAHERFLLDTYAERRAHEETVSRPAAWLRDVLARARSGP